MNGRCIPSGSGCPDCKSRAVVVRRRASAQACFRTFLVLPDRSAIALRSRHRDMSYFSALVWFDSAFRGTSYTACRSGAAKHTGSKRCAQTIVAIASPALPFECHSERFLTASATAATAPSPLNGLCNREQPATKGQLSQFVSSNPVIRMQITAGW